MPVRICLWVFFSSVQFSRSVVSNSLWPHEPQHSRPPCPSPTPRVYSKTCPSSQWCHPAISSSVVPLTSCSQSLPASGTFPMSQLFAWGGQCIGFSASASVLPVKTQDWLKELSFPPRKTWRQVTFCILNPWNKHKESDSTHFTELLNY